MPSTAIHVILVPGADALPFPEDEAAARERDATAHALVLAPVKGHPIDSRPPYFNAVADTIAEEITQIREATPGIRVFGIGRNHGGSLLAYAAARDGSFDGLVFPGVIPALSDYRAHSELASARKFRERLDGPAELARIAELRPFDMDTCLEKIDNDRCLIQVGKADDWMDDASHACFRKLEADYTVQWLDDDHAMAAPATVAARWDFIVSRAGGKK
ncbi:MAG: hypothetical protein GKS00_26520 [Alphaproteobacteria bacterium]|nr:hypothetical protein [Alphaproteobacteria bacterium]